MDVSTRIYMLRAKLLAAREKAMRTPEDHRLVALIDYSLNILQVVQFTLANEGGIFREDFKFLRGMESWLREYFHNVDKQ